MRFKGYHEGFQDMAEFSNDLEITLDAAEEMISQGQPEQALILLEKIEAEYPDLPDIPCIKGDAYLDMHELEKALDQYDRAVDLAPEWSGAYSARAYCLLEMGRIEEAEDDMRTALSLDSTNAEGHYVRAILLEIKGHQRLADEAYALANQLAPESFSKPFRLSKKDFDRAVRDAVKRLPARFRNALENVEIYVKDFPSPDDFVGSWSPLLLGSFEGPTFIGRKWDGGLQVPSRIFLYQKNIERVSKSEEDVIMEIEITLLHEMGHFFGLEEKDLKRLELD